MSKEYTFEHTLEGYNSIRVDMEALAEQGINWGDKVKVTITKVESAPHHMGGMMLNA